MEIRPLLGTSGPPSATMKFPRGEWMILLGASKPVANVLTSAQGDWARRVPAKTEPSAARARVLSWVGRIPLESVFMRFLICYLFIPT
jgi:hypothetical protein